MNRRRNIGICYKRIPILINEAVIAVYARRIDRNSNAVDVNYN